MSEYRWAVIRPDEDGVLQLLDEDGLTELFIWDWMSEVPEERDPMYWPERSGLLIKFQVLKPPAVIG